MMRLANKVALITGAGSGIGRASALLFARHGARVAVVDRNVATGQETEEEANVVLFLASDESSYVSGAVIPVDGALLSGRGAPTKE